MTQQSLKNDQKEDNDRMLLYQCFLYIPQVIYTKFINYYYNNLLVDNYQIDKTQELIAKKYY